MVRAMPLRVFVSCRNSAALLRRFSIYFLSIVYGPSEYFISQRFIALSLRSINRSICAPGCSSLAAVRREYFRLQRYKIFRHHTSKSPIFYEIWKCDTLFYHKSCLRSIHYASKSNILHHIWERDGEFRIE